MSAPDDETPAEREAAQRRATTSTDEGDAAGADEVQANMDEETEKGYAGVSSDPTPNEHYTVAGVIAGKPVPETHPEQAAKVAEHQRKLEKLV